ncbi:hypothetical protein [Streptomyces sp. DH37]|uniref:hypothetical protein n=1 Tax=Streptomyces sp. DH37 TaxID=3040122 RepID=UPI002441AA44|nr:hypothetical protein [Streptomyces sp. DH37]MDG9703814.1 hypothetical protein [Streptomyces sp. DH37]
MAGRAVRLTLTPGAPRRREELCPCCLLPSLLEVDLHVLSAAGVQRVATVIACTTGGCPASS